MGSCLASFFPASDSPSFQGPNVHTNSTAYSEDREDRLHAREWCDAPVGTRAFLPTHGLFGCVTVVKDRNEVVAHYNMV